jgi:hypothetical protein
MLYASMLHRVRHGARLNASTIQAAMGRVERKAGLRSPNRTAFRVTTNLVRAMPQPRLATPRYFPSPKVTSLGDRCKLRRPTNWAKLRPPMDRRQQPRVQAAMPVRVWGVDAHDQPFLQLARASRISDDGALLAGLRCQVRPGDIVDVQYGARHARCLVVWAGKIGSRQAGEIGVQKLPTEPELWGELNLRRCMEFVGQG